MLGIGLGIGLFGKSFSPSQLPLTAWYRAEDASVTLDGSNNVSTWKDKGPNGYDASQSNASLRPNYASSGGANGRARVIGPSSNDRKILAATLVSPSQPFEVFAALKPASTAPATNGYVVDFNPGNIQTTLLENGGDTWDMYSGSLATGPAAPASATVLDIVYNGNSSSLAINGGAPTTMAQGTGTPAGAGMMIGGFYAVTAAGFYGDLYEIIVCSRTLTDAERAATISYIKNSLGA